jgi:hypothetical protein
MAFIMSYHELYSTDHLTVAFSDTLVNGQQLSIQSLTVVNRLTNFSLFYLLSKGSTRSTLPTSAASCAIAGMARFKPINDPLILSYSSLEHFPP